MICRSDAQQRIYEALIQANDEYPDEARRTAARLVDEIYGVLGDDATNPRYGSAPAGLVTAGGDDD